MTNKCIIVDDEPLAIEVIESHLSHFNNIEIVGKCHNALEAVEIINSQKVDLIFLDIQMPHITGTEFLKSLSNPPKVILTTAYRDYAIEGFELNVLDYLLKPISFERFFKAMNKFFETLTHKQNILKKSKDDIKSIEFIYVKSDKKNYKVYLSDIVYIECMKDYISIKTSKKKFITKMAISKIEKILPSNEFLRIHRSYIISVRKMISFNSEQIEIDERELSIGRNYKQFVLEFLNKTR